MSKQHFKQREFYYEQITYNYLRHLLDKLFNNTVYHKPDETFLPHNTIQQVK